MGDQLDMKVSPVCEKNGKKFAYVSFSDGNRVAEGLIPESRIYAGGAGAVRAIYETRTS